MNILYLKYAVEVAKTKSISRAAENLYMGQPNLSRAIKELEESLGITIFARSPQGVKTTPEGEEFLSYAKNILRQIDEVEAVYTQGKKHRKTFSVSVPRSSYISCAFTEFAAHLNESSPIDLMYKETNAQRAVKNVTEDGYDLGIIRFQTAYEQFFSTMLEEKELNSELISEFSFLLLMSEKHPLAEKDGVSYDDLVPYTEIAHADPYVPSLSMATVRREETPDITDRRIFVFERASQFDLLSKVPGTFMWVSPIPDGLLEKYGLVMKKCVSTQKMYRDVLIYKKSYRLTDLDKDFITEVVKAKRLYLNGI